MSAWITVFCHRGYFSYISIYIKWVFIRVRRFMWPHAQVCVWKFSSHHQKWSPEDSFRHRVRSGHCLWNWYLFLMIQFIKWLYSYSKVIIHLTHVWKKRDLEWSGKHKPIVHLLLETLFVWISRDSLLNQELISWLPFCWLCSTCVRAVLQAVLKGDWHSKIFSIKETERLPGSF